MSTTEEPTELAALPEPEPAAALRPLTPGAFLGGEFEVLEVLSRGTLNLYRAAAGSYVAPLQAILVERAVAPQGGSHLDLVSPLFPTRQRFVQDDREYLAFPWVDTKALTDYRAPLQDEACLEAIHAVADGLLQVEQQQCAIDSSPELLRFDAGGRLCYYGFVDGAATAVTTAAATLRQQLAQITSCLLHQVYGSAATLRLDNALAGLALSDELKHLLRGITEEATCLELIVSEAASLSRLPAAAPDVAMLSDVGLHRDLNEDAALVMHLEKSGQLHEQNLDLWAVADGMGGHEGGEIASDVTLRALRRIVAELDQGPLQDNTAARASVLQAIDEVNGAVIEATGGGTGRGERSRPGATLVFALRLGRRLLVGNVGDSRAYKWNGRDGLQRITKDHSYVQNLIDRGVLSEADSWQHPDGSVITAHIGLPGLRQRDVFMRFCCRGDRLLLVSDGVVDMLREVEIAEIIARDKSAGDICGDLVNAANDAGGADNITAVCVIF